MNCPLRSGDESGLEDKSSPVKLVAVMKKAQVILVKTFLKISLL